MEEKIFVRDLMSHVNQEIISTFLVVGKEEREDKNKNFFLRMKLQDKTGRVVANVWNNARAIAPQFEEGDVVTVKGKVTTFNTQVQLSIVKVKALTDSEFDLADYVETTSKDINKLTDKLFFFIESMNNKYLKELLNSIFEDQEFLKQFMNAPAAKQWHHNYIGGLLEHSISVATICDFCSHHYPVDRDLVLTGGLLHDIGKVQEYSVKTSIDFTPIGRLLGHISIGDHFIAKKAEQINGFPPELLMKLRHLILAHHGEYEKASARLPQSIEAVVLHHADNLDAQTVGVKQLVEAVVNKDATWSEFDKLNSRYYYIK